jgi:hypothetical protein
MTDRAATLGQYRLHWPAFDLALMLGVMRGLMAVLILIGVGWLLHGAVRRLMQPAQG